MGAAGDVHPQIRALMEAEAPGPEPDPPDIAAVRAAYLQTALELGGAQELVADVQDVVIPRGDERLRARVYTPQHAATGGALVWLHGGGWCMGDVESHDRVTRALANASGLTVVSVDYRLAPEHPWPAAVEDTDAALRWIRNAGAAQLGIDPGHVLVGGDSAGGNLATVGAGHARGDGLPELLGQLLVYPALDPRMDSEAYRQFAEGPMLTAEEMARCWRVYLGGRDGAYAGAAPLDADLAGLPPAAIAVAGHDPLRDDGLRYAERLRDAGVAVEVAVFDDMVHGFLRWGGVVDRARELIDWLGARARAASAARSGS